MYLMYLSSSGIYLQGFVSQLGSVILFQVEPSCVPFADLGPGPLETATQSIRVRKTNQA
jgi:hypothetical protein